jgi:hypothetical protein
LLAAELGLRKECIVQLVSGTTKKRMAAQKIATREREPKEGGTYEKLGKEH